MYGAQDGVQFWLGLPSATTPGTVESYCTGNAVALGRVLANATHQAAQAYAQANLFGPLQITSARWNTYADGRADTGGHMHLRPRDMARIGQLALQRGEWNGVQAKVDAAFRLVGAYILAAVD